MLSSVRQVISKKLLKNTTDAGRTILAQRGQSVISGPPTVKVSATEKFILGGGMCLISMFIPAWVLYHIREYRGLK